MKRRDYTALIIVLLTAIAATYFIYRFYTQRKSAFQWTKTYGDDKREPYDFGMFKTLLQKKAGPGYKELNKPVSSELPKLNNGDKALYVFIGKDCYLNQKSMDSLFGFVSKGNDAIIIAEAFPDTLLRWLSLHYGHFKSRRFNAPAVCTRAGTEKFEKTAYRHRVKNDSNSLTDWYSFETWLHAADSLNQKNGFSRLHYIRDATDSGNAYGRLNHAAFRIGKGQLHLHHSPLLFSNYALRNASGFRYINSIFRGFEFTLLIYDAVSRQYSVEANPVKKHSDSPLAYILKQDSLRMAWYLFLFAGLVFLLFGTARRQRIIPLHSRRQNSSLSFVKTLGRLYAAEADYRKMCLLKMQLFRQFLKQQLQISLQDDTEESRAIIAERAGLPTASVQQIFEYYKAIMENRNEPGSAQLLELNKRISRFYELYYKTKI